MACLIFDFDQTLVDTRPVESLRKARKWSAVLAQVDKLHVYDGITELLQELHDLGHALAIVTKSPDMVPRAFAALYRWPIDVVVGYHQVKRQKPHPEGLVFAMNRTKADAASTYHIGDHADDVAASRAAGVHAIAAGWGAQDLPTLQGAQPEQFFGTVPELRAFVRNAL